MSDNIPEIMKDIAPELEKVRRYLDTCSETERQKYLDYALSFSNENPFQDFLDYKTSHLDRKYVIPMAIEYLRQVIELSNLNQGTRKILLQVGQSLLSVRDIEATNEEYRSAIDLPAEVPISYSNLYHRMRKAEKLLEKLQESTREYVESVSKFKYRGGDPYLSEVTEKFRNDFLKNKN